VLLSILVLVAGASFGAKAPVAKDVKSDAVAAQPSGTASAQGADTSYTIVKGDTLWALAEEKYGDPWVWSKLWQVNKSSISDPNIILANQVLVIPDKSRLKDIVVDVPGPVSGMPVFTPKTEAEPAVGGGKVISEPDADNAAVKELEDTQVAQDTSLAAVEEELPGFNAQKQEVLEEEADVVTTPLEQVTAKESSISKKYMDSASMVVPKDWVVDGIIVGEKDKKLMISAGDTVYVNLGKEKVKSGTLCMIYRKIGKIKNPNDTGSSLGYEIRRVGKLEITNETGQGVSSARIVVSYEPISNGDGIKIVQPEN